MPPAWASTPNPLRPPAPKAPIFTEEKRSTEHISRKTTTKLPPSVFLPSKFALGHAPGDAGPACRRTPGPRTGGAGPRGLGRGPRGLGRGPRGLGLAFAAAPEQEGGGDGYGRRGGGGGVEAGL